MRSIPINPLLSSSLAIFLIVTLSATLILDTWIQSIDVNFVEELYVADLQEAEVEAESNATHFFSSNSFEIKESEARLYSFIPPEACWLHHDDSPANSQRGPPTTIS